MAAIVLMTNLQAMRRKVVYVHDNEKYTMLLICI